MKKLFSTAFLALMAIVAMAEFPNRIYLCGPAASGWNTETDPMYTCVEADSVTPTGIYEWVGDLNDGDLKFLYGSSWEPGMAPAEAGEALTAGEHTLVDRPDNTYPDDKFAVTAGRYSLTINLTGESWTLTVADGTGLNSKDGSEQQFEAPVPANVYPIGDGTSFGWTPGSSEPIAKAADADIFDGLVFLKNGEFKLLHQADWGGQYGPVTGGEKIIGAGTYSLCKPEDDNKWVIEGIAELTAFHMIADVEAGTLVLRDTTVVIPALAQLYAIGEAVGGWSFDDNAVELLPEEGTDSIYYAKNVALTIGELKFMEKKDFGASAWGASVENDPISAAGSYTIVKQNGTDNKFLVMAGGDYDITINILTGTMILEDAAAEGIRTPQAEQKATKVIVDGQLLIKKGARTYNVLGF